MKREKKHPFTFNEDGWGERGGWTRRGKEGGRKEKNDLKKTCGWWLSLGTELQGVCNLCVCALF